MIRIVFIPLLFILPMLGIFSCHTQSKVTGVTNIHTLSTKTTADSVLFGVMSDTHITPSKTAEQQRMAGAFAVFKTNNAAAVVVTGDLTDTGSNPEYNTWKARKDAGIGNMHLLASMGNHERNTAAGFTAATGCLPSAHYLLNGYHFITLSPGIGNFQPSTGSGRLQGGGDYSYLVSWLKIQLNAAIADDPAKPIFVFFHHPIRNTFYVSDEWHGFGLESVFRAYPRAVTFAGHIHSPNNHPQSIWQDGGFTAINTVSLSYFELETGMVYGTIPPDASHCAQVLLVEAKGSVVTVHNYDLLAERFIPQTWVFDVSRPGTFPYTRARAAAARAPVFLQGAAVRLSAITAAGVTVNFDQAVMEANTIGDIVHSYRYDFIDRSDGSVAKTFRTWSEYYFLPMPATITRQVTGLKSGTGYEVRIYAIDAFGKTSSGYISGRFRLPGL